MIKKFVHDFLYYGVRHFEAQREKEKIFNNNFENQQFVEKHNEKLNRMIQTDEELDLVVNARKVITEDARKQLARRMGTEYPFIADSSQ